MILDKKILKAFIPFSGTLLIACGYVKLSLFYADIYVTQGRNYFLPKRIDNDITIAFCYRELFCKINRLNIFRHCYSSKYFQKVVSKLSISFVTVFYLRKRTKS